MRLTGTRTYYRPTAPEMPPGLVELMEGLTKDVLKNNPTDLYSFCASHMEQLLEKRDGPSRKKTLSLEDKIKRAQAKVRQKAEKRRQEYDKNVLAQTQINDVKNNSTVLDVPEANAAKETSIVLDQNNASILQDVQNNINMPSHHNISIDQISEVEISHESERPNKDIPTEKSIKSEESQLTDKINDNDMVVGDTNDDLAQSSKEYNEIIQEVSEKNTPNIMKNNVIINEPVVHVEIKQTPEVGSDMPPDTSVSNELSNKNANEEKENVEIIIDQVESKPVPVMESTPNSAEINLKEEVPPLTSEDNTVKIVVKEHNQSENADTCDVQKSDDSNNFQESNKTEDIVTESRQMPTITLFPPNTLDKDSNSTEQSHNEQIHTVQNLKTESLQLPTHIDNLELSVDTSHISDDARKGNNNSISPDSKIENITSEHKTNQELIDNEKTNVPVLETVTQFDLPTPDIDHGVQTMMTESTSGETDQSYDLTNGNRNIKEKDTPRAISDVDNDLRDYDNVTSNSVDLRDIKENSADVVANVSNDSHNDDTDDGKVEISTDVSDNTQTDNHEGNTMDLETAAVTIQKVFRNFLFKSRGSTSEDTGNDESNFLDEDDKNKEECEFPIASAINVDRRAHGITRMDTVLQTVNEEKSLSLSDDSSTLSSAATIIQAHVRGFLVRHKLNSNKTVSTNSFAASTSNDPSTTSLDIENDQTKNKTVLNIHIGGDNYLSRDESLITSMELSLDSPPSSINLHPLGGNISERRKQLKREDAIQSISPPSNNSGKLSEDVDSFKELSVNDQDVVGSIVVDKNTTAENLIKENSMNKHIENESVNVKTAKEDIDDNTKKDLDNAPKLLEQKRASFTKTNSDEMDVVTPFITNDNPVLIHSGEFHDAVLPTRVSRSDTSVVSGE